MARSPMMPMRMMAAVAVMLTASCGSRIDPDVDQAATGMMGEPVTRVQGGEFADVPDALKRKPSEPPSTTLPEGFTPEEDIVFTDPDDPDASLPELASILTDPTARRGPWEKSIQIAKRRAMREGKPLLVWFTDSKRSPMCKAIEEELFSQPGFIEWARENLIRMQVDESGEIDDSDLSLGQKETMRTEVRAYVKQLKQQYKVMGYPSLVLLSPSGVAKGHYRGYKRGESEFTWGLIRQGVAASQHSYQLWREDLESKGYRQWSDRRGRSVFAKLTAFREGELILIEPDGTKSRTHESKLSDKDRAWIAEQRRRRGA